MSGRVALLAVVTALLLAACSGSLHPASSQSALGRLPAPPHGGSVRTREAYYWRAAYTLVSKAGLCKQPQFTSKRTGVDRGKPSSGLLSVLAVLRRPHTASDNLPKNLGNRPPGRFVGYTRLASTVNGISYYVVPSSDPFFPHPIAGACYVDMVRTVREDASQIPVSIRTAMLKTVTRLLTVQRETSTRESGDGICVMYRGPHSSGGQCGANAGDIKHWGLLIGLGPISGVVPDGVASVTVRYSPGSGGRVTSATVRVVNNVFATAIARQVGGNVSNWPTVIWKSSDGKVINVVRGRTAGVGGSGWCGGCESG
jgi:hypothetical protein